MLWSKLNQKYNKCHVSLQYFDLISFGVYKFQEFGYSDFQYLLESGINELKTEDIDTSHTTNVLTFHNELTHLYDNEEDYSNTHYIPSLNISNHNDESLNKQILETYKHQRKLGRNIVAKHGIYYTFGLVYFIAQNG